MSNNKWSVEVKELEEGEAYINFPDELCEALNWSEGDELKFIDNKDGSFTVRKVKMATIELDFDDEEYFKYLQVAHERDMSFNEWVEEALTATIDMLPKDEVGDGKV